MPHHEIVLRQFSNILSNCSNDMILTKFGVPSCFFPIVWGPKKGKKLNNPTSSSSSLFVTSECACFKDGSTQCVNVHKRERERGIFCWDNMETSEKLFKRKSWFTL